MADNSGLDALKFYKDSIRLWEEFWNDSNVLLKDIRGKEIAIQLTRSIGSISANIEEGYGRGYGKEYPRFLKISRGSAQESKGWYKKSKFLLPEKTINDRIAILDKLIAHLTATISTLYKKQEIES
ncbi:MAG: four helix bundle protein [Bacteroidota bacterium]